MRISDWSSGVCSSDLGLDRPGLQLRRLAIGLDRIVDVAVGVLQVADLAVNLAVAGPQGPRALQVFQCQLGAAIGTVDIGYAAAGVGGERSGIKRAGCWLRGLGRLPSAITETGW